MQIIINFNSWCFEELKVKKNPHFWTFKRLLVFKIKGTILWNLIWSWIMWKILLFFYSKKCLIMIIPNCFPAVDMRKLQQKMISFKNYKILYLIHSWLGKALKGTVANLAKSTFHGGSLEITLTVPLGRYFFNENSKHFHKYLV